MLLLALLLLCQSVMLPIPIHDKGQLLAIDPWSKYQSQSSLHLFVTGFQDNSSDSLEFIPGIETDYLRVRKEILL